MDKVVEGSECVFWVLDQRRKSPNVKMYLGMKETVFTFRIEQLGYYYFEIYGYGLVIKYTNKNKCNRLEII